MESALAGPDAPQRSIRPFPVLTEPQIARLEARGRKRALVRGEVLVRPGQPVSRVFVVLEGRLAVQRSGGLDRLVYFDRGMFTGETSMLSGGPSLTQITVEEPGTAIEVERDAVVDLIRVDTELGPALMREFLLRRSELVAWGIGDVVLVGSSHSRDSLRLREFLTRNRYPHHWMDLDRDADVQALLERVHVGVEDVPVLLCGERSVLRNPSNREVADCLGLNAAVDQAHVRDLVVVGAGPAGLAAAVYAASEGLDVLVVEVRFPGGQAGSSSRIENYLGFPSGISGQELTERAYAQAQKFGAQLVVAEAVSRLACDGHPLALETDRGTRIEARAVVLATGAQYRKLEVENCDRFEGAGIYYAATPMEAQSCVADEVAVVGGGNSAGQAAVFLAESARRVHLLVRAEGLAATMSRYLIRRIEENPKIKLHTQTEVVRLDGGDELEGIAWRRRDSDEEETRPIRHLFVMAGADPNTAWLGGCLALDEHGFIKTGAALSPKELADSGWRLARAPLFLETSHPGVFAVGDVRADSLKRVASAVGEGSSAVALVHQVLRE